MYCNCCIINSFKPWRSTFVILNPNKSLHPLGEKCRILRGACIFGRLGRFSESPGGQLSCCSLVSKAKLSDWQQHCPGGAFFCLTKAASAGQSMTQPSAVPLLAECVNNYSLSSGRHSGLFSFFLFFYLVLIIAFFSFLWLQKAIYSSSKLYEGPTTSITAFSALKEGYYVL